jgi:hypothetical protein
MGQAPMLGESYEVAREIPVPNNLIEKLSTVCDKGSRLNIKGTAEAVPW